MPQRNTVSVSNVNVEFLYQPCGQETKYSAEKYFRESKERVAGGVPKVISNFSKNYGIITTVEGRGNFIQFSCLFRFKSLWLFPLSQRILKSSRLEGGLLWSQQN